MPHVNAVTVTPQQPWGVGSRIPVIPKSTEAQVPYRKEHKSLVLETQVRSLGWKDPLEKEMAIHSSVLACETSRTQEPGGLAVHGGLKESGMTSTYNT